MFSFIRRLFGMAFKTPEEVFTEYVLTLDAAYKRMYAYEELSPLAKKFVDAQILRSAEDPDNAIEHADEAMQFVCDEIFGQMKTSSVEHMWNHREDVVHYTFENYHNLLREGARLETNFLDARNDYIADLIMEYSFSDDSFKSTGMKMTSPLFMSNVVGEA